MIVPGYDVEIAIEEFEQRERVRAEDNELLTGDGEPVLRDAKARLQELVAKFPP